jgi:glutamate formiminotransferase/formiminotetrahydrofolate cyclodeaminase
MVANLSAHKRGWDHRWEEFSNWAEKGKTIHDQLIKLVVEDTRAFNLIMEAFSMPKTTGEEKASRQKAIGEATHKAIEVPFKVMKLCLSAMELIKAMAKTGNPNSISDAGLGALAARAGVSGAFLNVKINAKKFSDKAFVKKVLEEGSKIEKYAIDAEKEILQIVNNEPEG